MTSFLIKGVIYVEHNFNVDVATQYGLVEAILLNNIYFWVEHNKANCTHFYDGEYWTYNSIKAFLTLFPYLTNKKIRNALDHLEEENIIKSGNYNKSTYDRTKWYTITKKGYSILPKGQMDLYEKANGNSQKGEPIPDINTNIKTNIKNILGETKVSPEISQSNIYENIDDCTTALMTSPPPPQTPPPPSEHNILDKIEKKQKLNKTKEQKRELWINKCIKLCDKFDFTDEVLESLETYFNYLADLGTQFPSIVIELQLQKLSEIPSKSQKIAIMSTISRGWKSIEYVLDQMKKSDFSSYHISGNENSYTVEENQAWYDEMKRRAEKNNGV